MDESLTFAGAPGVGLHQDARARCRAVLEEGSKSFALASRLLPAAARNDAAVLYTFCRRADDEIDLRPPAEQPLALATLRARVRSIYAGEPQPDLPWQAFLELTRAVSLPREYPDELLRGMQMDVEGAHYEHMDDLLLYCHRVAGVVGLMLCHVFGVSRESALREAAHLGLAMQLTNISRDVVEDWERGRLYLPAAELRRAGAGELSKALGQPFPSSARAPVAKVLERMLQRADEFYGSADQGLSALPFRAALSVRAASRVYRAIGTRLRANGCDVLNGRTIVPQRNKLAIVLGSGIASLVGAPTRLARRQQYRVPGRVARFPEDVLV